MKKKLFLLLLIVALTAFVFTGCTPSSEGEGEGEGEGEIENVTVEVVGEVVIGNKTYVKGGNNTVIVSFPAPVENVVATITGCTGDFSSKAVLYDAAPLILFPNEDKTVWEGSGFFGAESNGSDCCASYIVVDAGECDWCSYTYPVIVDSNKPYAIIEVGSAECDDPCESGCALVFDIAKAADCYDTCCGDYCTELGAWAITIYDTGEVYFDCCDLAACGEPTDSTIGEGCPIKWTSKCLKTGSYYIVVSVADLVGNTFEETYLAVLDSNCDLELYGCECDTSTWKLDCDTDTCEIDLIEIGNITNCHVAQ